MAALDFPNAPTVGQQYTAPNGAVYTWDGAAWTVSGVISTGTAAGGDLTGSYPNPTIAAAKVTKAALAAGATLRQVVALTVPAGLSKTSITAWTDFVTLSMTTTGGLVVLIASVGWWVTGPAGSAWSVAFGWAIDQVSPNIVVKEHFVAAPGSGNASLPLPMVMAVHQTAAGAHVYHLGVSASLAAISVNASSNAPGTCWAVELS